MSKKIGMKQRLNGKQIRMRAKRRQNKRRAEFSKWQDRDRRSRQLVDLGGRRFHQDHVLGGFQPLPDNPSAPVLKLVPTEPIQVLDRAEEIVARGLADARSERRYYAGGPANCQCAAGYRAAERLAAPPKSSLIRRVGQRIDAALSWACSFRSGGRNYRG